MLIGLFRSNQPAVLMAVPVVVLGLYLPSLWNEPVHTGPLMPFSGLVVRALSAPGWLNGLSALLLVVLVGFQLALLLNALELLDRRNHLAAFLFPLMLAGVSDTAALDPALLGMPWVLMALRRTWSLANAGPALGRLFDAGSLIGIAALFYLPYVFMLFVIWASVSVIRPFAWREYVLPFLAVALVFYVVWGVLALLGHGAWMAMDTFRGPEVMRLELWGGPVRNGFVALVVILLLLGLAAFNHSYARSVMRGKNIRSGLMAFALALLIMMVLLVLIKGSCPAVLAAVPAGAIASYLFLSPRRSWMAELAAWTGLGLALWLHWT